MTLNPALEPSQAVNYTLGDHKETYSCIIVTHPRRLRILGDVIALMGQKSGSGGSAGRAQTRQNFGNSTDMMPIATHKAARQCCHCAAMLRHFPLNRTQNHSADPARFSRSASDRPDSTHRRRSNFADPGFLGDGSDFIDKRKRVCKFLQTGLKHRALGRWGKLGRARLGHPAGPVPEQNRVAQRSGDRTSWDLQHGLSVLTPPVRLHLNNTNNQHTHTRAHIHTLTVT